MAMQSAVKEALASAIARGVNPRGVHRARTIGASVGGCADRPRAPPAAALVLRRLGRGHVTGRTQVPDGEVPGHQDGARGGQVPDGHHGAGALAGE
jgi:hypothetical protein